MIYLKFVLKLQFATFIKDNEIQGRKKQESGTVAILRNLLDYHHFGHYDVCESKARCYAENNIESTMQYLNDVGKPAHMPSFAFLKAKYFFPMTL